MEPGGEYNFQYLSSYKFSCLENAEVKEALKKWSMIDGLKLQAYSFDKAFKKYNESEFLADFLGCQIVASTLLKSTLEHGFSPIGVPADVIKFSDVKCTLTTLELFDKLKESGKIVRHNGSIVKCMPEYITASAGNERSEEGFEIEIADNLRKLILSNEDESEDFHEINDGTLTEHDKKEFLFSLFTHCVIGGSLCQYEDNIEPYVMTTKLLYKDLIGVAAAVSGPGGDAAVDCNKLEIISHVYKIHSAVNDRGILNEKKNLLFNKNYLNNFFYVIVNPLKQTCFTLYHHV